MFKGYKVHVIRVEGGVGGGKYLKKCVYTSMIKEVMTVWLTRRDRKLGRVIYVEHHYDKSDAQWL